MATAIEKRIIAGFVYDETYSAYIVTKTPAPFPLIEGQTYVGTFDDIEYTKVAYTTTDPNQNTVVAIGGEEEDRFCIMYYSANDCVTFATLNEGESHNISTPADADNVVLKNYHGTNIAYDNVNYVALKKTDGGTAMFVSEHLVQNQVQSDWAQTDETAVDYIKNKPEAELPKATTDDNGKVLGVVDGIWSKIDAPSGGGNCSCPTGTIEKETKIEYTMTEVPSVSCDFLDGAKLYKLSDTTFSKEELLSSEWTVQVQGQVTNATWSESDIIINTEDILMATKDDFFMIAMCYKSGEITVEIDTDLIATVNIPEVGLYVLVDPEDIEYFIGLQIIAKATIIEEVNFVQSDWNQTDKTQPDYIKNRPFYVDKKVNEILPERTMTVSVSTEDVVLLSNEQLALWENGFNKAIVVWEGVTYECKPEIVDGLIAIGNVELFEDKDNGIPFLMAAIPNEEDATQGGAFIIISPYDSEPTERIFSVSIVVDKIVKIDSKFLPSIEWSKISNKPFGTIAAGEVIYSTTANCNIATPTEGVYGAYIDYVDFVLGLTYTVILDGISYQLTCMTEDEDKYVAQTEGDVQFTIRTSSLGSAILVNNQGEHTISIAPTEDIVKKIDAKYLPDDIGGTPAIDTTADEGKFLRVVGGVAAWSTVPNAEEASF